MQMERPIDSKPSAGATSPLFRLRASDAVGGEQERAEFVPNEAKTHKFHTCLLYTSDAADD